MSENTSNACSPASIPPHPPFPLTHPHTVAFWEVGSPWREHTQLGSNSNARSAFPTSSATTLHAKPRCTSPSLPPLCPMPTCCRGWAELVQGRGGCKQRPPGGVTSVLQVLLLQILLLMLVVPDGIGLHRHPTQSEVSLAPRVRIEPENKQ